MDGKYGVDGTAPVMVYAEVIVAGAKGEGVGLTQGVALGWYSAPRWGFRRIIA